MSDSGQVVRNFRRSQQNPSSPLQMSCPPLPSQPVPPAHILSSAHPAPPRVLPFPLPTRDAHPPPHQPPRESRVVPAFEEHGGCANKNVWTLRTSAQQVCVQRSKEKLISVEAVQTETAKAIVTESSAFAFPIGKVAVGLGSTVEEETIQVVAEDIILNGQKVRLRCGGISAARLIQVRIKRDYAVTNFGS